MEENRQAWAVAGAIGGLVVALGAWIGTAVSLPAYGGQLSLASLGDNFSMLYGNVAGILVGGAITGIGSLLKNRDFDWAKIKERITLVEATEVDTQEDEKTLEKAFKFSLKGGGLITLALIVFWPLPLYFSGYVFDLSLLWSLGGDCSCLGVGGIFLHNRPAYNSSQTWNKANHYWKKDRS